MFCFLQETSARPEKKAVAKKAKVEKAHAWSVFKVSSSQQPRCQKAVKPKSAVEDMDCGPVLPKWAFSKLILNKGEKNWIELEDCFRSPFQGGKENQGIQSGTTNNFNRHYLFDSFLPTR